jgi:hypothetical protein
LPATAARAASREVCPAPRAMSSSESVRRTPRRYAAAVVEPAQFGTAFFVEIGMELLILVFAAHAVLAGLLDRSVLYGVLVEIEGSAWTCSRSASRWSATASRIGALVRGVTRGCFMVNMDHPRMVMFTSE